MPFDGQLAINFIIIIVVPSPGLITYLCSKKEPTKQSNKGKEEASFTFGHSSFTHLAFEWEPCSNSTFGHSNFNSKIRKWWEWLTQYHLQISSCIMPVLSSFIKHESIGTHRSTISSRLLWAQHSCTARTPLPRDDHAIKLVAFSRRSFSQSRLSPRVGCSSVGKLVAYVGCCTRDDLHNENLSSHSAYHN